MAAPTTQFHLMDETALATAYDDNAERLGLSNEISTGDGNEWDFGSVNISGGQADSAVKVMLWKVSAWGANVQVENFRFWISTEGFDQAGSVLKIRTWKLDAASEWVQNPTPPLAGEASIPTSEPAQNVFQGGDGTTTYITTGDDDTSEAIAAYMAIDGAETTGVYKGTDAGYEFQMSFMYDYF